MVSNKETAGIRKFIVQQLRDEPDLSTLTIGILKKKYMAHVKCDSLSPEAKKIMKSVVEEELVKMQKNDKSESDSENEKPKNKRKREREQKKEGSEEENPTAKKSRSHHSSSSSDSEDDGDCKLGSLKRRQSQADDGKQEMKKSAPERTGNTKHQNTSDESSDEEVNESEESRNTSNSPEETVKKKANTLKNEEKRRGSRSVGKKSVESDQESDLDKSEKSDKLNHSESSDNEKENVLIEKKNESDSSSLPSLEEENRSGKEDARDEKKKKKRVKTDQSTRGPKDEDKAVIRLKRYIALCGVRRNYKKLLDGCRSTRSKVAVLKKELEDLGVHGNPSIEKCKKIRMKREEDQEVAELDVGNIITTEGRPKRRGTSARQERDPPSSSYQRTLNSGSDSDRENNTDAGRRKKSDWANLRGIISDDADSD
ncbi:HIRA-interacting protein 3 isoform X2 [Nematolebias whitei]|uniref:HIRA-interacting protein 3 isoform X2 n=1 Tax=Nematolebias whitei TaxID=451745 RepID=UPI0018978ED7|nr:HIRA-interacting protein 3 isoform X2 [Nematolebias whitei]